MNEKGSVRTVRGIKRHNDNQEHERSRWLGIKTKIIDKKEAQQEESVEQKRRGREVATTAVRPRELVGTPRQVVC